MPHFDWRKNQMTRANAQDAQDHVDAGHRLTDREWAIWVWTMTDVPTCPVCQTSQGNRLAATGYWEQTGEPRPAQRGEFRSSPMYRHVAGISYYSPAEIAKQGGEWDRASGGRMAQWCLLLDNNPSRTGALRANKSLARAA